MTPGLAPANNCVTTGCKVHCKAGSYPLTVVDPGRHKMCSLRVRLQQPAREKKTLEKLVALNQVAFKTVATVTLEIRVCFLAWEQVCIFAGRGGSRFRVSLRSKIGRLE